MIKTARRAGIILLLIVLLLNWIFILYDYQNYILFLETTLSPDGIILNPISAIIKIHIVLISLISVLVLPEFNFEITAKNAKRLFIGLIAFEFFLVLIYLLGKFWDNSIWIIDRYFDLDSEKNIPAIFSSIQLLIIGVIFFLAANRQNQLHHVSVLFMLIVSFGFVFLSIDEFASIHENISKMLRHLDLGPQLRYGNEIVIPIYFAIFLIISLVFYSQIKTMWNHFRHETFIMGTGVFLFVLGGSMEIIGGLLSTAPLLYKAEVSIEEFLEMFGCSLVLYGAILFALTKKECTTDKSDGSNI